VRGLCVNLGAGSQVLVGRGCFAILPGCESFRKHPSGCSPECPDCLTDAASSRGFGVGARCFAGGTWRVVAGDGARDLCRQPQPPGIGGHFIVCGNGRVGDGLRCGLSGPGWPGRAGGGLRGGVLHFGGMESVCGRPGPGTWLVVRITEVSGWSWWRVVSGRADWLEGLGGERSFGLRRPG
jgi:hypothetical protein